MGRPQPTALDPALVERFRSDLDALAPLEGKLGVAVSGGPDSIALLLLAAAARPGAVEAATVDHKIREESASEAAQVVLQCGSLGVPHRTLEAQWDSPPKSAVQERAREERYRLLARWMESRGLAALLTGHHADDQAETLLMRLNRGAGARGLAAMRRTSVVPGSQLPLLRPLLGWRRAELVRLCSDAGVQAVADPSNADGSYERVRMRQAIAHSGWLDAEAMARSAANLGDANDALDWVARRIWEERVQSDSSGIVVAPDNIPKEVQRRLVSEAIARLAGEGAGSPLRGRELETLIEALRTGGTATLRGVLCNGGKDWRFRRAPPRR